jgi:hypothetical protein
LFCGLFQAFAAYQRGKDIALPTYRGITSTVTSAEVFIMADAAATATTFNQDLNAITRARVGLIPAARDQTQEHVLGIISNITTIMVSVRSLYTAAAVGIGTGMTPRLRVRRIVWESTLRVIWNQTQVPARDLMRSITITALPTDVSRSSTVGVAATIIDSTPTTSARRLVPINQT